jgi:predicted acetyltransferase
LNYRRLSVQDIPQARGLWEVSFNDTTTFIDWYFAERFPSDQARGFFQDDRLLCMAQVVPYRFFLRGQWVPTVYIVGLATNPKVRKEGLATQLLQNILRECYHQGLGMTILMPAVPLFYQRRGWEYLYTLQKINFKMTEVTQTLGQLESSSIDPFVMNSLYQQTFYGAHGWLDRTDHDWQALLQDYAMDGGDIFFYRDRNNDRQGYILCQITPEQIKIRELAINDERLLTDALSLLARQSPGLPMEWQAWTGQRFPYEPLDHKIEPVAMARIVNLKHILESIQYPPQIEIDFSFSIYDPLLKYNCDTYRWHVHHGLVNLLPIPDKPSYPQFTIGDFTRWVMGECRDIPPEIAQALPKTQNYMNDLF